MVYAFLTGLEKVNRASRRVPDVVGIGTSPKSLTHHKIDSALVSAATRVAQHIRLLMSGEEEQRVVPLRTAAVSLV
jgi:hypothetical protein